MANHRTANWSKAAYHSKGKPRDKFAPTLRTTLLIARFRAWPGTQGVRRSAGGSLAENTSLNINGAWGPPTWHQPYSKRNLVGMASNLIGMASNLYNRNGLQPNRNGLEPDPNKHHHVKTPKVCYTGRNPSSGCQLNTTQLTTQPMMVKG